MERCRLSIQIEHDQKKQIEERIKKEYPKVKNISELVRAALKQFLDST